MCGKFDYDMRIISKDSLSMFDMNLSRSFKSIAKLPSIKLLIHTVTIRVILQVFNGVCSEHK